MKATDLTRDQQAAAAHTMNTYGGGFASAIAHAFWLADLENAQLLLNAFDELFMKYHRWNTEAKGSAQ